MTTTIFNVTDYGATGDGSTDDSTAFADAFAAAAATWPGAAADWQNERGVGCIYVPAGTYLIKSPDALMSNVTAIGSGNFDGLKYYGDGREASLIVFSPSSANQSLLTNNNQFLHLTFEDMSFYSTVSTASFMSSYSTQFPQNYVFSRVNWGGTWTYGLDLTGTNTNSEMSWFHCGMYGYWSAFLHAGSAVGSDGDQFLNYNFYACQNEVYTGNFVDMAYGGNVNVWGGSLIHFGNGTQTSSSEQVFFNLGQGVAAHGLGTQRLLVQGTRIEHHHQNSQLVNSQWSGGSIEFNSVDSSASQFILSSPATLQEATFNGQDGTTPNVLFTNCQLTGYHEYHYGTGSYNYPAKITYQSCDIASFASAAAFITITVDAGSTVGGQPAITFRDCRGNSNSSNVVFDTVLNWQASINAVALTRTVSVCMPFGGLPDSSDTTLHVTLPLNAVITRVRSGKPASGSSVDTNFTYTLTDANSTTIATAAGNGSATWASGYYYDSGALFHQCTTTNGCTLTLTSANIDQNQPDNYFLIDYLA